MSNCMHHTMCVYVGITTIIMHSYRSGSTPSNGSIRTTMPLCKRPASQKRMTSNPLVAHQKRVKAVNQVKARKWLFWTQRMRITVQTQVKALKTVILLTVLSPVPAIAAAAAVAVAVKAASPKTAQWTAKVAQLSASPGLTAKNVTARKTFLRISEMMVQPTRSMAS